MSKNEDYCGLCKVYIETAFTRAYATHPFVDGKRYAVVCHCCMSVPRMYEFKDNKLTVFEEVSPQRLHTLEEMVQDGFNKKQAEKSIKAVKGAIKKNA